MAAGYPSRNTGYPSGPSAGGGTLGWVERGAWDFSAADSVAAPGTDGAAITVAGLVLGTDNGNGGAGRGTIVNTNGAGLSLTPAASTAQSLGTSTRTATIVTLALDDLGLTAGDDLDALVLVQVAAYVPVATADYIAIGVESSVNRVGSGATGRGEWFGATLASSAVRLCEGSQVSGSVTTNSQGAVVGSAASVRVWALRIRGRAIECLYANDLDPMTAAAADALAELTMYSTGHARYGGGMPTGPMDVLIAVGAASAVSPPALTVHKLRVLERAVS